MKEGRGHRKLRLCSNKHYEKKKYFKEPKNLIISIPRETVSILRISIPLNVLSLNVSLPISAYTGCPISSLEVLYHRLKSLGTILNGIHLYILYMCVEYVICRVEPLRNW